MNFQPLGSFPARAHLVFDLLEVEELGFVSRGPATRFFFSLNRYHFARVLVALDLRLVATRAG